MYTYMFLIKHCLQVLFEWNFSTFNVIKYARTKKKLDD